MEPRDCHLAVVSRSGPGTGVGNIARGGSGRSGRPMQETTIPGNDAWGSSGVKLVTLELSRLPPHFGVPQQIPVLLGNIARGGSGRSGCPMQASSTSTRPLLMPRRGVVESLNAMVAAAACSTLFANPSLD